MNFVTYSRFKIFLSIIAIFFVWQILKVLPSLQPISKSEKESAPKISNDGTPVLVAVFYEALCPDSKNFITKHLLPAVVKAPSLVNVSFVPYGKAKTEESSSGKFSFACQHGPTECAANKIHACAVSTISSPLLQVQYISCMISDNMIPEWIGEKCAKELLIDWETILQCSKSAVGSLLLRDHGIRTDSLKPKISFVPTVLLNGELRDQASILKNFFIEVCSMMKIQPKECSGQH